MSNFSRLVNILQNTGERPILNTTIDCLPSQFTFAYKYAARFAPHQRILDYGCGGGYGAEFLSRFTRKPVVAFDPDQTTITTNKLFFAKTHNLSFCSHLAPSDKYNLITCFQVIEHLPPKQHHQFITNLKSLLLPHGVLLLSTPNKNLTSRGLKKPIMVFHHHEFMADEFYTLLRPHFSQVKIFGQLSTKLLSRRVPSHFHYRLTRQLSQFELVRLLSRHLPISLKLKFMNNPNSPPPTKEYYKLCHTPSLINQSLCLIAVCHHKI